MLDFIYAKRIIFYLYITSKIKNKKKIQQTGLSVEKLIKIKEIKK